MRPLIFAPLFLLLSTAVAPAQTGTLDSWGYDLNGQVSSTPDGQDFVQVPLVGDFHQNIGNHFDHDGFPVASVTV